jgi:hypothetical protein
MKEGLSSFGTLTLFCPQDVSILRRKENKSGAYGGPKALLNLIQAIDSIRLNALIVDFDDFYLLAACC